MPTKPAMPLIAKLQSAPDAVWDGLLGEIETARNSYDPASQTGGHVFRSGNSPTYRTSSSGGPEALSAEDSNKKPPQDAPAGEQSYRTMASGGSTRFPDDGSKEILPERGTYRAFSSGGPSSIGDDGQKGAGAGF